jgi:hypothetical protein
LERKKAKEDRAFDNSNKRLAEREARPELINRGAEEGQVRFFLFVRSINGSDGSDLTGNK